MKLENTSTRNYIFENIILKAGEIIETEDKKAIKVLLSQEGVKEAIDVADFKKLQEEKELADLKVKALELGVKFQPNIKAETLQKKIDEALKKQV